MGLVGGLIILALILNPFKQNTLQSGSVSNQLEIAASVTPSKTLKTYTDPSGFSFSYPDNLSLLNNELKDANSYAELQLTGSGVEGSLVLKIADSKLASLDEWIKTNKNASSEVPKEVKLGNLKALEIKNNNKLLLGALDQGILFTIEVPLSEKDFWMDVYTKVIADFSFVPPSTAGSSTGEGSSSDVTFDGEEVVN